MDDKTKAVLLRCARVYISTKNWQKALVEYRSLYADFPDDPLITEPLARCYLETGNLFKAREMYDRVAAEYTAKGDTIKADRVKADIAKYFPNV
ncbi:MAG: tetratricopeptide repeat protein [Spirochaetia bacterium]|nr:tetratricopeptide repeat protein [Spirochaetia bacterium]